MARPNQLVWNKLPESLVSSETVTMSTRNSSTKNKLNLKLPPIEPFDQLLDEKINE